MDWIWIITGVAIVLVFACMAITVVVIIKNVDEEKKRGRKQDFQEVLIRNGVNVRTGVYEYSVRYFPNKDGLESFSTIVTGGGLKCWDITLSDRKTGKKYTCSLIVQAVIGRDPIARNNESRIVIPDGSVSKTHCKIAISGDALVISDEKSRNGTYLNGKLVVGSPALHSGDTLTIGNSTFDVLVEKRQ